MLKSIKKTLAYAALAGIACVQPALAQYGDETGMNTVDQPSGFAMAGDALVARPLMFGATVLGTGVFLVSLPFSVLGGNVDQAGETLVAGPAKATFVRCLGCVE